MTKKHKKREKHKDGGARLRAYARQAPEVVASGRNSGSRKRVSSSAREHGIPLHQDRSHRRTARQTRPSATASPTNSSGRREVRASYYKSKAAQNWEDCKLLFLILGIII